MLTEQQRKMLGMVDCPGCGFELAAPLAAAHKVARCTSCGEKFQLPSAQMLFNNAAVYLMVNEVEQTDSDEAHIRDLQFSPDNQQVIHVPTRVAG
ncbi:MAG: hypothetical protein V3V20_01360 [Algisphaera sp.]